MDRPHARGTEQAHGVDRPVRLHANHPGPANNNQKNARPQSPAFPRDSHNQEDEQPVARRDKYGCTCDYHTLL